MLQFVVTVVFGGSGGGGGGVVASEPKPAKPDFPLPPCLLAFPPRRDSATESSKVANVQLFITAKTC